MVNITQSENKNENEEFKLSPLGSDEINSVIKSFKNSTFNHEEFYKKDEKNFVKKTLFDLAKEAERTPSKENQSEIDVTVEENELEKTIDENQEFSNDSDQKNDFDDTEFSNELYQNHDNKEKEADQVDKKEKEVDQVNESIDETLKLNEVFEEKIDSEKEKSDQILNENNDPDIKVSNEKNLDANPNELNKTEYEEKTLEALDSVREAVTKSLEENSETQNEEIKNNSDDTKIVSNEIISEIKLINNLFKNIREISSEEIENIVKSKVIELAEAVIGYEIEKFPDKFLKKIKNSIKEIKSINNNVKVYLNDKDLELLNKFLDTHNAETDFKLDLDTSLGRGDFTIDIGGVIQAIKYKKVID